MITAWYPDPDSYFADTTEAADLPVRQGDVFVAPEECLTSKGKRWFACQLIQPSCEVLSKNDPKLLQTIRVRPLRDAGKNSQVGVVAGSRETDGEVRIFWAHTFFLPPVPGSDDPAFSNFRDVQLVSREALTPETRIGCLTHDARVYLQRRMLYWRYRWALPIEQVYALEAERIRDDPNFIGQKPAWAS